MNAMFRCMASEEKWINTYGSETYVMNVSQETVPGRELLNGNKHHSNDMCDCQLALVARAGLQGGILRYSGEKWITDKAVK